MFVSEAAFMEPADTLIDMEQQEHQRPNRPGIVWAAGSRLEASDVPDRWYTTMYYILGHLQFECTSHQHLTTGDRHIIQTTGDRHTDRQLGTPAVFMDTSSVNVHLIET